MGYGTGKDAISRWREGERAVLEKICKAHGIEIAAPEKSRGSLTVEQYKEYAELKEKADTQRQEVEHLNSEIGSKELILEWRKQAVTEAEAVINKIDAEYQEKTAAIQQLDNEISEKEKIKTRTEATLAEKQDILSKSVEKVVKINTIDHIETGKTVFGGKVTISPDDYDRLTDLAKKQIAAESQENSLRTKITTLETQNQALNTEKEQLTEQNTQL